jgi:hypothetical protein
MSDEFTTLARAVRDKRAAVAVAKEAVDQAKTALDATAEAEHLRGAQNSLALDMAACTEAENALRRLALEKYLASGEKKFPGVSVKVGRKVTYVYEDAESWVKTHMPALLILDKTAFEKYVLSAHKPPPVVKIEDDPKTAIATKLEGV